MKKTKKVAKAQGKQALLDVSDIQGLKVIPIRTRKFVQYDLDFTAPFSKVELPDIDIEEIKDAIVKVNIRVKSEDAHKINAKKLEDFIREHVYLVKPIVTSIQKERVVRIKHLTPDLTPLKAIEAWLINKGVRQADLLLDMAKEIMTDE